MFFCIRFIKCDCLGSKRTNDRNKCRTLAQRVVLTDRKIGYVCFIGASDFFRPALNPRPFGLEGNPSLLEWPPSRDTPANR